MCERYNGWKNYPTWCVKLWLDNEPATQERALEYARDAAPHGADAVSRCADNLRDWAEDEAPELQGMTGDLFTYALEEVDWREIAAAYLEDIESGY